MTQLAGMKGSSPSGSPPRELLTCVDNAATTQQHHSGDLGQAGRMVSFSAVRVRATVASQNGKWLKKKILLVFCERLPNTEKER